MYDWFSRLGDDYYAWLLEEARQVSGQWFERLRELENRYGPVDLADGEAHPLPEIGKSLSPQR